MSDFQKTIESLEAKLKFIASLEPGQKINTVEMKIDEYSLQFLWRWYNGSNRYETLKFIENVVQSTIDHYSSAGKTPSEMQLLVNLMMDIISSKRGIINLQATYCNDVYMVSQLQCILEKIDIFTNNKLYNSK